MPQEPYDLSTGDVARMLAVGTDTVVRYADRGDLACIRLPGRRGFRRFRRSDVDAFLERAAAAGSDQAAS